METSSHYDPQMFRIAFIQSAAIIFVLVCGACTLLVYRVLEPFLRSILWSILAGAFLFPFKKRLTLTVRTYLHQLDTDSHLLFIGLVILLPLRTIDRAINSIFSFSKRKWKELLIIFIVLLLTELVQTDLVYHLLITTGYGLVTKLVLIVPLFDSLWVTTLLITYFIAILTIYDSSSLIRSVLNIFTVPVWLILLIYLSQFLPIICRLVVIILSVVLTLVGFFVEIRECTNQVSVGKFKL